VCSKVNKATKQEASGLRVQLFFNDLFRDPHTCNVNLRNDQHHSLFAMMGAYIRPRHKRRILAGCQCALRQSFE